jgi:hypothetical protein
LLFETFEKRSLLLYKPVKLLPPKPKDKILRGLFQMVRLKEDSFIELEANRMFYKGLDTH